MTTSDATEILLRHDRWATGQLIDACATLPDAQFHQNFEMGPGSLHDTLTHMLSAVRGWGDLIGGREQRDLLEVVRRTPKELAAIHDELASDFEQSVRAHPADELVTGSRGGRTFTFARGAVATHVATHGMHHRAQCVNMLRQLGVEQQPPTSVLEWILMVDAPPGAP